MGYLHYGHGQPRVEVDDVVLAHLKVAIFTKLRREEKFLLSWDVPLSDGSGHGTLWLHPTIPLYFEFSGGRTPRIHRGWIEEMLDQAAHGELLLPPGLPERYQQAEPE